MQSEKIGKNIFFKMTERELWKLMAYAIHNHVEMGFNDPYDSSARTIEMVYEWIEKDPEILERTRMVLGRKSVEFEE